MKVTKQDTPKMLRKREKNEKGGKKRKQSSTDFARLTVSKLLTLFTFLKLPFNVHPIAEITAHRIYRRAACENL